MTLGVIYTICGILLLISVIIHDIIYGPGEMLLCLIFPPAWFMYAFIIFCWPLALYMIYRDMINLLKIENYKFDGNYFNTLKAMWEANKRECHRIREITRQY